jgi:hypothetical protein
MRIIKVPHRNLAKTRKPTSKKVISFKNQQKSIKKMIVFIIAIDNESTNRNLLVSPQQSSKEYYPL